MRELFSSTLLAVALVLGLGTAVPANAAIGFFNVQEQNDPFYPLVKDGFKDVYTVSGQVYSNESVGDYQVIVRDPESRILVFRYFSQNSSTMSFGWDGRDDNGDKVAPDTYQVDIFTTNNDGGEEFALTEFVEVKTRTTNNTYTKVQRGREGQVTRRGDCYVTRYAGALNMDCLAYDRRSFAQANYRFGYPKNATNLNWHIAGRRGCCSDGQFSKVGVPVSDTRFLVSMYISGTRAYEIRKVTLSYRSKVKQ